LLLRVTQQGASERIARVEAFVITAELAEPFGFSQAWVRLRRGCLVKVTAESGQVGWGECFGHPGPIAATITDVLAPVVVGRGLHEIDAAWDAGYNQLRDFGMKGLPIAALSGVDIALHDLLGRSLGVPVHVLLGGGFRRSVQAYASGLYWRPGVDIPEPYVEEAQGYEARGFRAVKMKGGRGGAADAAMVAAVRGGLSPATRLMMDANRAYDAQSAIRLGRAAEGVDWFEEPVAPEDLDGYRAVRAGIECAVAGGEAEATRYGFRDLIGGGCVDVVQPDTCLAGGLSEARRILALALAHGIRYVPHVWGTAIGLAAALQLLATIPLTPGGLHQLEPLLELDQTPHPFRKRVAALDAEPDGAGRVSIPDGPGLGIEVDEEYVRSIARAI
jgi:D-galactarolactone cycloisomerase